MGSIHREAAGGGFFHVLSSVLGRSFAKLLNEKSKWTGWPATTTHFFLRELMQCYSWSQLPWPLLDSLQWVVQKERKDKSPPPEHLPSWEKLPVLPSNKFQVHWAVEAQEVLCWAGHNTAEITKNTAAPWERKKALELQGDRLLVFSWFSLALFNLIWALLTDKSIVCMNPGNIRQTKSQTLSVMGRQDMVTLLKRVQNSKILPIKRQKLIQSQKRLQALSVPGPHAFIELYLVLLLHHLLFTWLHLATDLIRLVCALGAVISGSD